MALLYGYAPVWERSFYSAPHGNWNTHTLISAMTLEEPIAGLMVPKAVNGDIFNFYVEQILVPALRPGQIVVMDNLMVHKSPRVHEMIKGAGAERLLLPRYSPDHNPVENKFSKIKALVRKAEPRTVEDMVRAVGAALDMVTPAECWNYFKAAGFAMPVMT